MLKPERRTLPLLLPLAKLAVSALLSACPSDAPLPADGPPETVEVVPVDFGQRWTIGPSSIWVSDPSLWLAGSGGGGGGEGTGGTGEAGPGGEVDGKAAVEVSGFASCGGPSAIADASFRISAGEGAFGESETDDEVDGNAEVAVSGFSSCGALADTHVVVVGTGSDEVTLGLFILSERRRIIEDTGPEADDDSLGCCASPTVFCGTGGIGIDLGLLILSDKRLMSDCDDGLLGLFGLLGI